MLTVFWQPFCFGDNIALHVCNIKQLLSQFCIQLIHKLILQLYVIVPPPHKSSLHVIYVLQSTIWHRGFEPTTFNWPSPPELSCSNCSDLAVSVWTLGLSEELAPLARRGTSLSCVPEVGMAQVALPEASSLGRQQTPCGPATGHNKHDFILTEHISHSSPPAGLWPKMISLYPIL